MNDYRSYTRSERRERAWLALRTTRQSAAGPDAVDPRLMDRMDRIDAAAADRGEREALALLRQNNQAQDAVAAAVARERAARGPDRKTAREARREAERRAADTERAARRAGL